MKNNQLIIDTRNTGKTTYLFSKVNQIINNGNSNIIIIDSATEHEDKSLLKKVEKKYKHNTIIIDMQDSSQVVIDKMNINEFMKNFMNYFPFKEIIKNKNKIICFDLSYFLEKGHELYEKTNSKKVYDYYRQLYNNLSQQIIVSLILMEKYNVIKNVAVVMDEIEFPVVNYDISTMQNNLSFLASVHSENSFGTFYSSFDRLKFSSYVKRKE